MLTELKRDADLVTKLFGIMEELHHLKDLDALLDQVLLQARRLTNADAGSIYIIEKNLLKFSYIHNDTLFDPEDSKKYIYASRTLAINASSLAGYVALTGESLLIANAQHLPAGVPFTFNDNFDKLSGYTSKTVLAVPLKTSQQKIVGVLEIINALDEKRQVVAFSQRDRLILNYFANHAAAAIERALLTREVILRMIKMCELRDPQETGAHANRVAAFSAEIYRRWALNKGLPREEIRRNKDLLRIAAMLHDIGKIAISDLILRKPGGLDTEEFATMKFHTIFGARLFLNPESDLDLMSTEIALNHHERWDGRGYPGRIADIFDDRLRLGQGKQGEEIPIFARIVALADVYDALISKRIYKDSLPEDQVLEHIKRQSGRHFDPEVVQAFLEIYDVIAAIREKYQEAPSTSLFGRLSA